MRGPTILQGHVLADSTVRHATMVCSVLGGWLMYQQAQSTLCSGDLSGLLKVDAALVKFLQGQTSWRRSWQPLPGNQQ